VQLPTDDLQAKISEKLICESTAEMEALIKRDGKPVLGFSPEQQHSYNMPSDIKRSLLVF
jgi:hypothetical protein